MRAFVCALIALPAPCARGPRVRQLSGYARKSVTTPPPRKQQQQVLISAPPDVFINSPDAQNVVQLPARERGTVEQHWNTQCCHSGTTVQRQWDSGTTTVERTALGHGLSPAPASTATTIAFGQLSSALPLPPPPSSHACPPSSLARHAPRSFSVRLQVLHNADAADVAAVAALAAPSTLLEQTDFNCNCLRRGALHCASLCVCCVFVACVCECASQCFSSCRGFYVLLLLLLLSLIQRVACSSGKRQQLLRQ